MIDVNKLVGWSKKQKEIEYGIIQKKDMLDTF